MIVTIESQEQRLDLRARRRIRSMRGVQAAALDLFEERGFEKTTVEEIAAAAEVGVATVYRQFGSKERIVLWDEYDPLLFEAIAARLPRADLRGAILEALIDALDGIYRRDASRILRRARIILAEPAMAAAAAADQAALRRGLSQLLREHRACRNALEANVVAAAVAATLVVAVEHWVAGDGALPLRHHLRRAFERLGSLADRGAGAGYGVPPGSNGVSTTYTNKRASEGEGVPTKKAQTAEKKEAARWRVGVLLLEAARSWRRRMQAALKPFGLTPTEFLALDAVARLAPRGPEGATQQMIADDWPIDKMTVSTAMHSLDRRGLVCRGEVLVPASAWGVLPTPEGRALLRQAAASLQSAARAHFGRLGTEEAFVKGLRRLRANRRRADRRRRRAGA